MTEAYREDVDRKMQAAYAMTSTADAERALETLRLNRLALAGRLCRMLATANPIESTFSLAETVYRRVKC